MLLSLVADIGGTNSRFALVRGGQVVDASRRNFRNADYPHPKKVLARYMSDMQVSQVASACLGVAGPVQGEEVRLTNYPWTLTATDVTQATGAGTVTLLNDLQAQGYALHGLAERDRVALLPGQATSPEASRLIVAIGTGVNAAVAHRQRDQVLVPPSESGHVALPLRDDIDLAFAAKVRQELGHCPVEAALSGAGLVRLWRFFGGDAGADGAGVLVALNAGNKAATQAVQRFVTYLAHYCADLALVHLPMGGIFLAGSVGVAIAPHLQRLGFATAFHRPGPYAGIHRAIPVFMVPEKQLTLAGCAVSLQQGKS